MKAINKKELFSGVVIAALILLSCYFLIGIGAGPCNAVIGLIYSIILIGFSILFSAFLSASQKPAIYKIARIVLIMLISSVILFLIIMSFNKA